MRRVSATCGRWISAASVARSFSRRANAETSQVYVVSTAPTLCLPLARTYCSKPPSVPGAATKPSGVGLTTAEIAIVRKTWAPVSADLAGAGKLFYKTMFADNPELPNTDFKGVDMDKQALKLMTFVNTGVSLLDDPEKLVPALIACGERHGSYGTADESYPVVGAALIKTLKIALGDAMTAEATSAWAKLYGIMSQAMIQGQHNPNGKKRYEKFLEKKSRAATH